MLVSQHYKYNSKCRHSCAERYQGISEQVHAQKFYGRNSIYMGGVPIEYLNKSEP